MPTSGSESAVLLSVDPEKVAALMKSINEVGLQEPIDVLEVDGQYWGFSG
jgi:sulfiredoxin